MTRFLPPDLERELERQEREHRQGVKSTGKTKADFEVIDADGTKLIEAGPIDDDTQMFSFVGVPSGTFFPNPQVAALGLGEPYAAGAMISKEQAEKDTEALLEYDRRMNPPDEFRIVENDSQLETPEPISFGEEEEEAEEDSVEANLTPDLASELRAFAKRRKDFNETHPSQGGTTEFYETVDKWSPADDRLNEANPMQHPPVLKAEIVWTSEQATAKPLSEVQREQLEHVIGYRRLDELPMLLKGAESKEEWAKLRVEQLVLCGMSTDAAVERAVREAEDGCLGHLGTVR